jgi:hypothetical protein
VGKWSLVIGFALVLTGVVMLAFVAYVLWQRGRPESSSRSPEDTGWDSGSGSGANI